MEEKNQYSVSFQGMVSRRQALPGKSSVEGFGAIEHRLELVADIEGKEYVNDSKSTDVHSTWYSLDYMTRPVIWIVGTSDMEVDYTVFQEVAEEKVKVLIVLGDFSSDLYHALKKHVKKMVEVSRMEEAVNIASALATSGHVILFSPGCPAYEMYSDYRHRGEHFRKVVNDLKSGK